MTESSWYNTWHSHRGHGLAHWFLFFFIAILITSAISEGINKNYLTENLDLSAAAVNATMPTRSSKAVPGQYIIVFKDGVKDPKGLATQLTKDHGAQLLFAYENAIKGFAAKIPEVALNGLKKNPNIEYIEEDQTVQATAIQTYTMNWGLDRIDQTSLPTNGSYTYNSVGSGVHAYVVDTGIRSTHREFTGRMGAGYSSINDAYGPEGCNWHGTHVAGILGGKPGDGSATSDGIGVAKAVTLHSVRVLDCQGNGSISGVIAGVDWIAQNKILPAVANMSLSGGFSTALNEATRNLVNSGVITIVAAGNSASDACYYSPAGEPSAITVGASDAADSMASYSNWGTCVDVFAPGTAIVSSSNGADDAYIKANGTSMATPHVAGVAALYLQVNPTATPSQVAPAITNGASKNVLTNLVGTSVNLLVDSLFSGGTGTAPDQDTQSPTSPTNLSATAPDSTKVNLSWGASTDTIGVGSYQVYRNSTLIGSQPNSSLTSYTDSTVVAGTTYTYSVTAKDTAGNTSPMSNTASVVVPSLNNPPSSSTLDILSYSVSSKTATTVTLKWTTNVSSTGSINYTPRNGQTSTVTDSNNVTSHSITLTGLTSNTQYSYKINAVTGSGADSVTGSFKTSRR